MGGNGEHFQERCVRAWIKGTVTKNWMNAIILHLYKGTMDEFMN